MRLVLSLALGVMVGAPLYSVARWLHLKRLDAPSSLGCPVA